MKRQDPRPQHPFAGKLSLDDAVQIRARYAAGESARQLAAEYGIAPASVHAVLRGRAHPTTLSVTVEDSTYSALAATATATCRSLETVAAQLIEREVSKGRKSNNGESRNDNGGRNR